MIERYLKKNLIYALERMPVVALLGPRQVGKTTLALNIAKNFKKEAKYLDLELDSDLVKLDEAEAYLRRFDNKLLVIDEVQRKPDLFRLLRGIVDFRKRAGEKTGQFLLLGSASRDLIQHSSETLAGRLRYIELAPFSAIELNKTGQKSLETLWLRGGFPDSYLAATDDDSWDWRSDFIASYLERDIPLMGPNVSTTTMRRLWSMLAHNNGQQVNYSKLGESLGFSYKTIKNYIDTLTDFYMLRQVRPWAGNTKKRLVKSPKIYLRDTGIAHRFLNITDMEDLLGHPGVGASWEAFVIENILRLVSDKWQYSYYRSTAQAEIDLVLEGPQKEILAIEIKRSIAPKVSKGFHYASDDIEATEKIVIYPGTEQFPLGNDVEVVGMPAFIQKIAEIDKK